MACFITLTSPPKLVINVKVEICHCKGRSIILLNRYLDQLLQYFYQELLNEEIYVL